MANEITLDTMWRRAYELYAAVTWLICALILTLVALFAQVTFEQIIWVIALISWGMMVFRGVKVFSLLNAKLSLAGNSEFKINSKQLVDKIKAKNFMFYAGKGFDWTSDHTQKIYDIKKYKLEQVMPPAWLLKLKGIPPIDHTMIGDPTLHGIETVESDIFVPMKHLEGHAMIFGLPGSGKTTYLRMITQQAIHRGDVVIVVDPKGDAQLEECCRVEAKRAGREKDFALFHLAHPERSIRLDPLRNWNRPTELASRIKAVLPSTEPNDPFTSYAWGFIHRINMGLIYLGERPNLKIICHYVETGIEPLLERVLDKYLRINVSDPQVWDAKLLYYINRAKDSKTIKLSALMTPKLAAMIEWYEEVFLSGDLSEQVVNSILSQIRSDKQHGGKLLASSLPTLVQLTSGEVGDILSPNAADIDDHRPILDSKKIINGRKILYMGLDALPDPVVASAVGSITLADIVSVAGDRYNYGVDNARIVVIVDELSNVVNEQLTQLVGKGRGSGFTVFGASQNFPDFVVRLGSEEAARQFLGNFNTLIMMRSNCKLTQEYAVETFGESFVNSVLINHNSGTSSGNPEDQAGGYGARNSETLEEAVPSAAMGRLPNFHYFAQFTGGRIVKGRIPILEG